MDLPTEGIYTVQISTGGKERVALLNLTKMGVVVKVGNDQNDVPSALIYVADLETGEPVEGVEVSAWVRKRVAGRKQDRLISSPITNTNGLAHLSWKFKVSHELLPDAYVTASLVWQKKFAGQSEPLRFYLDNFRLKVSGESDRGVYEPREPAKLTV